MDFDLGEKGTTQKNLLNQSAPHQPRDGAGVEVVFELFPKMQLANKVRESLGNSGENPNPSGREAGGAK